MRKAGPQESGKKNIGDTGFNAIVEQINRDAKNTNFFEEGSGDQVVAQKGVSNFSRPTTETFNSKNSLESYSRSDSFSSEGLNNESQKQEVPEQQQGSINRPGKSNGNGDEEGQNTQSASNTDNFQQVGRPKRKDQNQHPYQPGQKSYNYQGNKYGNNQMQNPERGNKTYTPNQYSGKYPNNGNMNEGQGFYNQSPIDVMKTFSPNWQKGPADNFKYQYNVQNVQGNNPLPYPTYAEQPFVQPSSNFNVYPNNFGMNMVPSPQPKSVQPQFYNNTGLIPNGGSHMISNPQQPQVIFTQQLSNQPMPNTMQSPSTQMTYTPTFNVNQFSGKSKRNEQNRPYHHQIDLRNQFDSANLKAEVDVIYQSQYF